MQGLLKRNTTAHLKKKECQRSFRTEYIESLKKYGTDFKYWTKRSKGYEKYRPLLMDAY